ncbi:MAG TPA: hypothetical protein VFS87_05940 [Qipengyuania sp.]|nr:hypothetical protein [Qipengyuania sp.]
MGKLDKILDHLPGGLSEKLQAAVDDGRYESKAEVLLDAIHLWNDQETLRKTRVSELKALIAEAEEGPYYPAEEVFQELRQRAAARATQADD